MGWRLVGKRVAFTVNGQWGTYAEYAITQAAVCVPIPDDMTFDQASCSFVNPLTAVEMLEDTKAAKVTAIVHTAAASQLGRMMVRYFQTNGINVINVVRRKEQVEILEKEGAKHVLDQNDPEFT